jgi:23S rRNA (cytidine2498-2'-O)-methyltransferase
VSAPVTLARPFAFVLCQPGAERALKRELAREQPSWSPAYQRPGLVTFKLDQSVGPELTLRSTFARQYGVSLGNEADLDAVVRTLRGLPTPLCLHVVERAPEDPDQHVPGERARQLEEQLRTRCVDRLSPSSRAKLGQLTLTVVVGDEPQMLLGLHRHATGRSPYPGGRYPITLPPEAPSRAYLKIEEAIAAFALPIQPGHTALELGAAPGGAVYALLRRGVHVLAVDPAELDARVLAFEGPHGARATHLRLAASDLRRDQLPAQIDWLLLDVHLAPGVALRAASRVASMYKRTLRGAVLTLKLNDWSFADRLDTYLAQAKEMGLVEPQARQLVSHRQELAIVGLTRLGREHASPPRPAKRALRRRAAESVAAVTSATDERAPIHAHTNADTRPKRPR